MPLAKASSIYISIYHLNTPCLLAGCGTFLFKLILSCRFLRINLPAGGHPSAVSFADDASSIVVACHTMSGSSLYMYGEEKQKEQQSKLPLPSIKWERHHIHDKRSVLTLSGATATYGTADGSAVIASCSEGLYLFCYNLIYSRLSSPGMRMTEISYPPPRD